VTFYESHLSQHNRYIELGSLWQGFYVFVVTMADKFWSPDAFTV